MFNKLLNFLNEEYKEYEISKIDDLLDIKKMNFYFILFKYILKNSFYIYQIPFLLNIRKIILSFKKSNFSNNLIFKNNDDKEKNDFILKTFFDSKYYENVKNDIFSNSTITIFNKQVKINNREYETKIFLKILNT